jgi:hypothetical protein
VVRVSQSDLGASHRCTPPRYAPPHSVSIVVNPRPPLPTSRCLAIFCTALRPARRPPLAQASSLHGDPASRRCCAVPTGVDPALAHHLDPLPGLATPLPAQSIVNGTVRGTIKDSTGRPLGNVRVALTDKISGFTHAALTPRAGTFVFQFVPPGEYDLLAERLGFLPVELRGVTVVGAGDAEVDVVFLAVEPPVMERAVEPFGARLDRDVAGPGWQLGTGGVSRTVAGSADCGLRNTWLAPKRRFPSKVAGRRRAAHTRGGRPIQAVARRVQ